MLLNGVLLASFILCFLSAIQTISLTLAILLVYLAPALSAIIAHFLFAERLTSRTLLLILLAFFGFAMLQEFQIDSRLEQQQGLWYALALFAYLHSFYFAQQKSARHSASVSQKFLSAVGGLLLRTAFHGQSTLA